MKTNRLFIAKNEKEEYRMGVHSIGEEIYDINNLRIKTDIIQYIRDEVLIYQVVYYSKSKDAIITKNVHENNGGWVLTDFKIHYNQSLEDIKKEFVNSMQEKKMNIKLANHFDFIYPDDSLEKEEYEFKTNRNNVLFDFVTILLEEKYYDNELITIIKNCVGI